MNSRVLPVFLIFLTSLLLVIGCGGTGSGSSYSSSWLGVITDPNAAGSWQIEVRPSAVSILPGQAISVAVLVKDAYGHPLNDVSVQLASYRGTFEDQSGNTTNGWFTTRFTAGPDQGTEMITALANGIMGSKALVVQQAPPKVPVVRVITSAATTLAENAISVAVGVTINGTPADNTAILLSSTIPGTFDSDSGQVSDGWFSTSFKPAADAAGVGTITALVHGVRGDASLAVVKQKKESPQLTIAVNPDSVYQGQTAAVIVLAKDAAGFPSSAKIYLSGTLEGTFGDKDGTPEDGVFYTEFTAGNEVGSATLTVSSLGASASVILSIERPEIVMNISASMDSVKINERVPVSVLVTDVYQRPINNAPIHLTAGLGCYLDPESGNTNDDGYAFFEFVASKTAGISTIHALTEGATASAQINVVGP